MGKLKGKCVSCGTKYSIDYNTKDKEPKENIEVVCGYCGAKTQLIVNKDLPTKRITTSRFLPSRKKKGKKIHEMSYGKVYRMVD